MIKERSQTSLAISAASATFAGLIVTFLDSMSTKIRRNEREIRSLLHYFLQRVKDKRTTQYQWFSIHIGKFNEILRHRKKLFTIFVILTKKSLHHEHQKKHPIHRRR